MYETITARAGPTIEQRMFADYGTNYGVVVACGGVMQQPEKENGWDAAIANLNKVYELRGQQPDKPGGKGTG